MDTLQLTANTTGQGIRLNVQPGKPFYVDARGAFGSGSFSVVGRFIRADGGINEEIFGNLGADGRILINRFFHEYYVRLSAATAPSINVYVLPMASDYVHDRLVTRWSYAAATGGIIDTADVTVRAAASNRPHFVRSAQIINRSAVATEFVIRSAATVLWRMSFPASMNSPEDISFQSPLPGGLGEAIIVACATTGAAVFANLQGTTE